VTTQVPVPAQSPLQPAKLKFGDGIGVSVTTVPTMYDSEQSVPQLMPGGVLVTSPFPRVLTVRVKVVPAVFVRLKLAGVGIPETVAVTV